MDRYLLFNRSGRGANKNFPFTAATTTTTLITALDANRTIYVQRIVVWITTSVAQSLTFQDTAGTPFVIAVVPSSPGANTRFDFDFGPEGIALTKGKNLQAVFSAAGLAGHIVMFAYQSPMIESPSVLINS
jgi:hypothetical protein